MKLLIDTSIIIDYLRRKDKENSLLYSFAASNFDLYIPIIVHTELFSGKSVWESKKAKDSLQEALSGLTIINLTPEISRIAGEIKAKYLNNLFDAIIAASALKENVPIATLNIKDFKKVPGLKFKD